MNARRAVLPVTVQFGTPAGRGLEQERCFEVARRVVGSVLSASSSFFKDLGHSGSTVITLAFLFFPANACKTSNNKFRGRGGIHNSHDNGKILDALCVEKMGISASRKVFCPPKSCLHPSAPWWAVQGVILKSSLAICYAEKLWGSHK